MNNFILMFLCAGLAFAGESEGALQVLDKARSFEDLRAAAKKIEELPTEAEPSLRAYFSDPSKDGRKRAIALKGLLRHKSSEQVRKEWIEAVMGSKDEQFRLSCVLNMGQTKDRMLIPFYRERVLDEKENGGVRNMSAQILASLGDDIGKPTALEAVIHPKGYQDFGMQTLVILKATDLLPKLKACALSEEDYLRKNSCNTAALRIRIAQEPENEVALLSKALYEERYFDTRDWAIRRLAQLKSLAALAVLCEAVRKGVDRATDGIRSGVASKAWTNEDAKNCR